jgi:hypothetical protein
VAQPGVGVLGDEFRRPQPGLGGVQGAHPASRPRLAFNCGWPSLERARSAATALALRPDMQAIARSDRCGCDAVILFAAIHRSLRDSGSPWSTFAGTASRKASSPVPSKSSASIVCRPCATAASMRCVPSMICIVRRFTRMGGKRLVHGHESRDVFGVVSLGAWGLATCRLSSRSGPGRAAAVSRLGSALDPAVLLDERRQLSSDLDNLNSRQ